jgi:hypothetical protein
MLNFFKKHWQILPAGKSLELSSCGLADSGSSARQMKKLRLALKTASLVFVDKMLETMTSTKPRWPVEKVTKHFHRRRHWHSGRNKPVLVSGNYLWTWGGMIKLLLYYYGCLIKSEKGLSYSFAVKAPSLNDHVSKYLNTYVQYFGGTVRLGSEMFD